MTAKPIIFSAPMVLALLAGRKTQTRRVLKPQPFSNVHPGDVNSIADADEWERVRFPRTPGDRLWVREACRAEELSRPETTRHATPKERDRLGRTRMIVLDELDGADGIRYLADDAWLRIENTRDAGERWSQMFHYGKGPKDRIGNVVSPIHMPRWASRLTLTVTDVRVQRVQEISEEDALAEGIYKSEPTEEDEVWNRDRCAEEGSTYEPMQGVWMAPGVRQGWGHTKADRDRDQWWPNAIGAYRLVWDSLNAKRGFGWDANPWVSAISFTFENRASK